MSDKEDNKGLIFSWKQKNKALFHISVFFIVATVIHIAGFYLFQVVYPSAGKIEPVPDRITILDMSDPAVHAMMGKVQDRVIFLRPASEGSGVRATLEEHAIQFKPSFSNRNPNVKLTFPAEELGLTAGEKAMGEPLQTPDNQ